MPIFTEIFRHSLPHDFPSQHQVRTPRGQIRFISWRVSTSLALSLYSTPFHPSLHQIHLPTTNHTNPDRPVPKKGVQNPSGRSPFPCHLLRPTRWAGRGYVGSQAMWTSRCAFRGRQKPVREISKMAGYKRPLRSSSSSLTSGNFFFWPCRVTGSLCIRLLRSACCSLGCKRLQSGS